MPNYRDGSTAHKAFTEHALAHLTAEEIEDCVCFVPFEALPAEVRERWALVEEAVCKRYGAIY